MRVLATAKEQLRALELNAWQLFHLVDVRSPGSLCVKHLCSNPSGDWDSGSNSEALGRWSAEKDEELEVFCELFKQAIELQSPWRHMDSNNLTGYNSTMECIMYFEVHSIMSWPLSHASLTLMSCICSISKTCNSFYTFLD